MASGVTYPLPVHVPLDFISFSPNPVSETDQFHVTTFRGWPHQRIKNEILKIDSTLRMGLRKIFKKGVRENPHVYKKQKK